MSAAPPPYLQAEPFRPASPTLSTHSSLAPSLSRQRPPRPTRSPPPTPDGLWVTPESSELDAESDGRLTPTSTYAATELPHYQRASPHVRSQSTYNPTPPTPPPTLGHARAQSYAPRLSPSPSQFSLASSGSYISPSPPTMNAGPSPSLSATSSGSRARSYRATPPAPAPPQPRVLAATDYTLITEQGTSGPAVAPDVVMSWTGGASSVPDSVVDASPPARSSAPEELPPSYDTARVPTAKTKYTFSPQTFNTMLLLPPAEAQDTRPVYHISVALNCFIPFMSATTVRRGASEFGDYIAEFEMGYSELSDTVTLAGVQKTIGTVITKEGSRSGGTFTWKWMFPNRRVIQLIWSVTAAKKFCVLTYPGEPRVTVAEFVGISLLPYDGKPRDPSTLTIFPAAHEHRGVLDHILVSVLIIERMRLTKKFSVMK